jgi:hypothetical protein
MLAQLTAPADPMMAVNTANRSCWAHNTESDGAQKAPPLWN